MKRITAIMAVTALCLLSGRGQGFVNLNFESAQNLPAKVTNSASVYVTNALPGWTAYNGGVNSGDVVSKISYVTNSLNLGVTLALLGGSGALGGNFSVFLGDSSAISQTAVVPVGAASLQFEATEPQLGLYITLGGQTYIYNTYTEIAQGSGYNVYGLNIPTALDGQVETLIFGIQGSGETLLDNITFSTSPVPEPSMYGLMGLGSMMVAMLAVRRRR